MSSDDKYCRIIIHSNGFVLSPMARVAMFLRSGRVPVGRTEARAVAGVVQFSRSLSIVLRRLREHLEKATPQSVVDVPFDELYFDTQSLFLLVSQFFEDCAAILRLGFPKSVRRQLPQKFRKLIVELPKRISLPDPFAEFLIEESDWFLNMKDIRDDILHPTFDRSRSAQLPGVIEILRSFGGGRPFPTKENLTSYLRIVVLKVLVFATLAEDFFRERMIATAPDGKHKKQVIQAARNMDVIMPAGEDDVYRYFLGLPPLERAS